MIWNPRRNVPVLFGLLLLAGCTASGTSDDRGESRDPAAPAGALRLVSFDSCEQATEQLRAAAREHVGPWGFSTGAQALAMPEAADGAAESRRGAAPAAPKAPADAAAPEHSGTNVHEAGVDEPDLVKTDGRRIVTIGGGRLRVVDAERRVQLGSLDLGPGGYAADLLLAGDRALVLMADQGVALPEAPVPPDVTPERPAGPRMLLVDLTGPGVISEYATDGWMVDARAAGTTARVVVRSSPRIAFPEYGPDTGEKARRKGNRKAVAEADLADWLPRYEVSTGGETSTGRVDCTAMSRPASYSGSSMLTVLTFDLTASGLGDGAPVSVVADGDTVYSNGPSLYVATDERWRLPMPSDGAEDPEVDPGTEIHKFDTSRPDAPTYLASGRVDGWLLNQYSMSEWEGHLRVATTSGETFFGEPADSESAVYVLAEQGRQLVVTGSVGGLGKGERIHSVRFTGPVGYVVTFRQTDPLYTVDLRDPAAPAVLGELKVTGYSAYLHPIDDGRLIGVGQEADLQGVTQGTQVSLFDVSDLSDPTLQAKHLVPHGSSEAEFDPHAFLWWPVQRLLVLPLHDYQDGSSEALLLRAEETGFTELGRISHPDGSGGSNIRRSLVIGDTLWTVSDSGLAAHSLSTLEQSGWVAF